MEPSTCKIVINGTVQGVGFRPFVYQLATLQKLKGTVSNTSQGVVIVINATDSQLKSFLNGIRETLPPLSTIDTITTEPVDNRHFDDFQIIDTEREGVRTVQIPPDVSICEACEKELSDPKDRRYGYPFISCTHCGVRYSIIYDLPYDRDKTSMKFFEMCPRCEKEYRDPLDRRYHAQPIGCWECGPTLSLWDKHSSELKVERSEILDVVVKFLLDGNILAVKGVGGYHLVCDATNDSAVRKLRERKRRPSKPFAVMVKDMEAARRLAEINPKEEALLSSKERPIVLLNTQDSEPRIQHPILSRQIAPGISRVGLFLPYAPLHLLLLHRLDRPLIATSANMTDEPICTDRESIEKLSGVYDYLLDHNREIVNGCDDSVVMVVRGERVMLRRARGYAPASVKLPFKLEKNILALGANQKSTIAIGFDDNAILSPHIGDLDGIESVNYFKKNIDTLERIYHFKPEVIAHDRHPNYESTKLAKQLLSLDSSLLPHPVQHHYAHILGVMAEKHITGKVLGVAFDGTGYGDDGNLWGGEFLLCDYGEYERVAHIDYFKLLGGSKAIKEPRRAALSLLFDLYGEEALDLDNPTVQAFTKMELQTLYLSWEKGLNAPLSSSAGRIFDAVASLTGVCQVMSFEGESGMLMEALYDSTLQGHYRFVFENGTIELLPVIREILAERDKRVAVSKFFHTLVELIDHLHHLYSDLPLVLSGGVFQNRILLELILDRIPHVIIAGDVPPNDGGIALGQIVSRADALWRMEDI